MSSTVPSLTALLAQSHIEDHEKILKAAELSLKKAKSDLEAQHVKVVALLKLDRFDDAVRTFETCGDDLKQQARLEHAYALYKTGKPAEAADVAREGSERGTKHVEAQACYRTEDFRRAAEIYQDLASRLEGDAEADLRINTGAVDAQLEWTGLGEFVHKRKPSREDLDAFETAYNAACASIARGELGQGEILLKRAKELCHVLEDLTEDEKLAEVLPITIQQIYVLARLGRAAEAEKLAQSIELKAISDRSTRNIAQVNAMAVASNESNPFLAQRLLSEDRGELKQDHPFNFQDKILRLNKHASDLKASKFAGSADSTAAFISKQPAPTLDPYTNSLSVVNEAAYGKLRTGKEALKHILPVLEQRPRDVGLILTIVQLYVLTGNSGSAITLLESFLARLEQSGNSAELDVRFAPGLVGALTSLYHDSGRKGPALREFAKAATYWRRKSKDRTAGVVGLLRAAGSALLDSQEPSHRQLVTEIFEELHAHDESDRYAAAGLLAAWPQHPASSKITSLTPIDGLITAIDVDALEAAGIAQPPATADGSLKRKRAMDVQKPRKVKKIRKTRMPKDFDASKKPDPERWLPLRDRSTYRPKGKKGKAKQALLSQGSAPAVDGDGSRPATPGAEVVKAKQQQGGGGAKKKKVKGKW